MNVFCLKIVLVLSILCKKVFCDIDLNENKDTLDRRKENNRNANKNIITLSADCFKNGSILLTLYTNEPFTGSIYSRSSSVCKTVGDGKSKRTKLFFNDPNECGVQFITANVNNPKLNEAQRNISSLTREVAIYVQYDRQVQQAIDEQFLVQCKQNLRQGLVTYGKDSFLTTFEKTLTQKLTTGSINLPKKKNLPNKQIPQATKLSSNDIIIGRAKKEDNSILASNKNTINIDKSFVWRPKDEEVDFRQQPATGWMDITPLEAPSVNFKPPSLFIVGQPVNLVIRIRQSGGRDTMLSSCIAYTDDSSESEAYDLTDYRGCALDLEIMPNFGVAFNSKTSIKRLETSFPMFKFPDADKVHVKCNVLVCKKNCPVARCNDYHHNSASNPQEEFINVSIIDKFLVKTSVDVVDFLEDDYDEEENEVRGSGRRDGLKLPRGARYDYSQPLEPFQRPQATSRLQAKKSNYHRSGHEVEDKDFTVNENKDVEKSAILHSRNPQPQVNVNNNVENTSDLLCLSPSRLIIAFGILLVILLLALTASCVLWLKARSALRRPKPAAILTRAQRHIHPHHPPPGTRIVPARPVFVAARTPVPYMRTAQ